MSTIDKQNRAEKTKDQTDMIYHTRIKQPYTFMATRNVNGTSTKIITNKVAKGTVVITTQ